jgi:hypothetical protein
VHVQLLIGGGGEDLSCVLEQSACSFEGLCSNHLISGKASDCLKHKCAMPRLHAVCCPPSPPLSPIPCVVTAALPHAGIAWSHTGWELLVWHVAQRTKTRHSGLSMSLLLDQIEAHAPRPPMYLHVPPNYGGNVSALGEVEAALRRRHGTFSGGAIRKVRRCLFHLAACMGHVGRQLLDFISTEKHRCWR